MSLWVSTPPITTTGSSSVIVFTAAPSTVNGKGARNGRAGGQDRDGAWSRRRLFGHSHPTGPCQQQDPAHRADTSDPGHNGRADQPVRPDERDPAALLTPSKQRHADHPCRSVSVMLTS